METRLPFIIFSYFLSVVLTTQRSPERNIMYCRWEFCCARLWSCRMWLLLMVLYPIYWVNSLLFVFLHKCKYCAIAKSSSYPGFSVTLTASSWIKKGKSIEGPELLFSFPFPFTVPSGFQDFRLTESCQIRTSKASTKFHSGHWNSITVWAGME